MVMVGFEKIEKLETGASNRMNQFTVDEFVFGSIDPEPLLLLSRCPIRNIV